MVHFYVCSHDASFPTSGPKSVPLKRDRMYRQLTAMWSKGSNSCSETQTMIVLGRMTSGPSVNYIYKNIFFTYRRYGLGSRRDG